MKRGEISEPKQATRNYATNNKGFTHLAPRDFKPRGCASGKEILSHVQHKKKIKEKKGEKLMRHRAPTSNRDGKIFARTAVKTKKINVSPKVMRGGIRL